METPIHVAAAITMITSLAVARLPNKPAIPNDRTSQTEVSFGKDAHAAFVEIQGLRQATSVVILSQSGTKTYTPTKTDALRVLVSGPYMSWGHKTVPPKGGHTLSYTFVFRGSAPGHVRVLGVGTSQREYRLTNFDLSLNQMGRLLLDIRPKKRPDNT